MPAQPFSVNLDPDDLLRRQVAAAVSRRADAGADTGRPAAPGAAAEHHGARDPRLASRERSGRDRSGRAGRAGGTRSYAFRRS